MGYVAEDRGPAHTNLVFLQFIVEEVSAYSTQAGVYRCVGVRRESLDV